MAGLLGDVLPYIYQRANALKRGIGDFVADPMGSIAQGVNYANDRAGGLLAATRAAADEGAASGGLMYGPANKQLAGILANAYNPMGITVYHGSPHKFAKFDSSKIGTGEGAQAYGHGLYLAESPETARFYKDQLTDRFPAKLDGRPMTDLSTAQKSALGILNEYSGNVDGALAFAKRDMQKAGGAGAEFHVERYNTLLDIKKGRAAADVASPSLYKVDLPDSAVARMLDWDKPLSQQAQNVKDSLDALKQANPQGYQRLVDAQLGGPLMDQAAGMDLYRNLIKGANERQMAEVMRQQGVPGIRYLDGGSRGQGGGTSNFVIFPGEESLLTILERNGMPLPK